MKRIRHGRLLTCALAILPLAVLGCGEIPPDPPAPETLKEFLRGELHDRLVLDPVVGRPPGMPPEQLPPPDSDLAFRPPEAPLVPPPTIRTPGVSAYAKLDMIQLGKGSFKEGTWTLPFEATQELSDDLYELVPLPEVKAALDWSDAEYQQACETALRCRAFPRLLAMRRETERTRPWAMELKHRRGSKYKIDGILTAKRMGTSGPYALMLVSATPREVWPSTLAPALRFPYGVALVRFDRGAPQKGAAEWAQPFNAFIQEVQKCKDAELAPYRKLAPEMVATMQGFGEALASVKDEASATAAIPVIEKLAMRAAAIQSSVMKHEASQPVSRFMEDFEKELHPQLEKPSLQVRDEGLRIKADKTLFELVGPAMIRFATVKDGKVPPAGRGKSGGKP